MGVCCSTTTAHTVKDNKINEKEKLNVNHESEFIPNLVSKN